MTSQVGHGAAGHDVTEPRSGDETRYSALVDAALPALLNDLASASEDVCLVLDDYHVVTKPDLITMNGV